MHLVFSNHLDLGYSAFVNEVVNQYLFDFFPQVTAVAKELRERGDAQLRFMTHPWLLEAFFSCPCRSRPERPRCMLKSCRLRRCPEAVRTRQRACSTPVGFVSELDELGYGGD